MVALVAIRGRAQEVPLGETRKKFKFKRQDGSVMGHGAFMRNMVLNMTQSGQLEKLTSTRKPFAARYGGLQLSSR